MVINGRAARAALRDALGDELAAVDEPCAAFRHAAITRGVMSAA
jgi:hypothetical protein